ncbi:MAG: NAD(P)/FAD-dependent oxidoreductase [Lachnospiraceae bacterium]|nr:NAD(P)/FAD-dependent oxidoreductase [Lachnospiraceae bacterium]
MSKKVLVAGAGASGLMAAYSAAAAGALVTVAEKNEKAGKKIYITGKGRCNLTNNCDRDSFLRHVVTNPKFLYSAINAFDAEDTMTLFESLGCRLKTERGNRVFPVSDHASDVTGALVAGLRDKGAEIRYDTAVSEILHGDGSVTGVKTADGEMINADCVIICTGGLAYPSTGSDGDGYRFAEETGHRVTDRCPSLVRLRTTEDHPSRLQGLSLKNVKLTLKAGKKTLYSETGEMLFTDDGLSGPLVLSASAWYALNKAKYDGFEIHIDLKCGSDREKLDSRVLSLLSEMKNRSVANALVSFLPRSLLSVVLEMSGIDGDERSRDVTREERMRLLDSVKDMTFSVLGSGPFTEAVITHGGVDVRDVDPHTMESKLVKGLYFCGEVLDTDALTGGYNLQTAWSTGYLAGTSAACGGRAGRQTG